MSNPTVNGGQNSQQRDSFMERVDELGAEAAKGKDALPKLGLAVLTAANEGLLDPDKWPPVAGKDAVAQIYAKYAAGARKTVHEHSADSLKAQESKLRAFYKAGRHVQHGLDPVIEMDRAVERRSELSAADPKVLKPAYQAYYCVAIAITATKGSELTKAEIDAALFKASPKEKNVAEELKRIYKAAEAMVTGDKGLVHRTEGMIDAVDKLRDELEALGIDPDEKKGKGKKDKNGPQPMGPGGAGKKAKAAIDKLVEDLAGGDDSDDDDDIEDETMVGDDEEGDGTETHATA